MTVYTLATGSAESRAPALNVEQLLNLHIERTEQDSKTQAPLFQAPGLAPFFVCGTGPIRGTHIIGLNTYVVSGSQLYQIALGGVVSLLGSGLPGTGLVSMADNGTQLCMVFGQDAGQGYIWSIATGLIAISSVNYFPSLNVLFFDGYFIFNRSGSTEIFFSALFDGTTFNGADFFNTESTSTPVFAIAANLQLLFFFKLDVIEMWYDSGAASNPFQRYAGGVISYGCASAFCVTHADGALFFLGNDGVIYRLQANVPIRVSTHAIEKMIADEVGFLNLVSSFAFTAEGHKYVVFHLPHQGRTIAFDISSGKWHERQSYNAFGASIGMWRASCGADGGGGGAVLGDRLTGQTWLPSLEVLGEGTFPIYCQVTSGVLQKDRKRLTINNFEIDMQMGVGNGAAPNPTATLYTSKDGGATWQSRGAKPIPASAGLDQRIRWSKLGSSRQWSFRIVLNDPVQRVIIGAYFDVSEGI